MQLGRSNRATKTLEREKEMDSNNILNALVKDLAEHLRPMVAEMVRAELITGHVDLAAIAENIDLEHLARSINLTSLEHLAKSIDLAALAGELTSSQLADIAGDIDLDALAEQFDADQLAEKIDLKDAISEWFSDQSFSITAH